MDRRYLKVEVDHSQSRLKRPRINFTLRGWDFIDGKLEGCFVSPVTGKLQPIPNAEEPEFQTSNSGRFAKLQLSGVTTINGNSSGSFEMVAAGTMHLDSGIKFTGQENTAGIGVITTSAQTADTGWTCIPYAYDTGTDQDGPLICMFWADDQDLTGGGLGIKTFLDGRLEVYKDDPDQPVFRGSFSGSGYDPGSVRGGSYQRPSDQFVAIRVEASQGRFLTITSSLGGVCQFAPPWAIDRYNDDGTLFAEAEPILPAKKFGWYQPNGGGLVVSAPVVYGYSSPYAISQLYSFAEVPTYYGPSGTDVLTGRVLPYSPDVTVTLVKADGVTPYDRTTKEFRAKVTFSGVAFVSGVVGAYPRIAAMTPDDPTDISEYVLSCSPFSVEDGPQGAGLDLILRGDCPVPFIEDAELRPFRVSLIPHADDPGDASTIVLLDGVGDAPEWVDGIDPKGQSIHIRVWDRMRLVREAKFRETVVVDGMPLCCPPADGESWVGECFREGGIRDTELVDLPRIENPDGSLYVVDDTPSQIAGEWNFYARARELWEDKLIEAFEMAPKYAWGLKPTVDGTRAYAIDVQGADAAVATFYRTPETAALDPDYEENELGAWPLLYGVGHRRIKLPKEGNVVRVVGRDPGTGHWIQAFIRDATSADPEAPISADKLGVPREVFRRFQMLTTQAAVNALCRSLYVAVSQRQYTEPWPAFMRFKSDGSPVWRGDKVILKGGMRDGSDSTVRVSGFSVDIRDESGGGLMDDTGRRAPVSIRLTEYSGGAICNNGGASAWQIARRQRDLVADGGVQYGFVATDNSGMGKANQLTP